MATSPSNVEDLFVSAPASTRRARGEGLTTKVEGPKTIGRGYGFDDKRKFKHDRYGAQHATVGWHVSKDDRMEAQEAGNVLEGIHVMFGIEKEDPGVLEAFNNALFFNHTINSGSVLQPGRSGITLSTSKGDATTFDYSLVVERLGVNQRRFFRAFADEVARVNQMVIESHDPSDPEAMERFSWLMQVASERELSRFPHLAHDTSDACASLSPAERSAVAQSKVGVLSKVENVADATHSNARFLSVTPSVGGGRK